MVFYRDMLRSAMDYLSVYYQKVLLVNLDEDSFEIIKMDDSEMNFIYLGIKMSEWFSDFSKSPFCHPVDAPKLYQFSSMEHLKSLKNPEVLYYKKLISGDYHNVMMELLPIGNGKIYLMVKDLTKMLGGVDEQ